MMNSDSANSERQAGAEEDQKVIDWLCDEFKKKEGTDLCQDKMALMRLKGAVEKAKVKLLSAEQTTVNLPFVTANSRGPKHMNITLTRAKLEQLVGTKWSY
jgi:molecular chaperone DnaK